MYEGLAISTAKVKVSRHLRRSNSRHCLQHDEVPGLLNRDRRMALYST